MPMVSLPGGPGPLDPPDRGGADDQVTDIATLGSSPRAGAHAERSASVYLEERAAQGEDDAVGESALLGSVVVSTEILRERSGVADFRQAARSANTLLAYRRDWDRFTRWCARHGVSALPAEPGVVASYLADAANTAHPVGHSAPWRYSPATLARWLATINKAHDLSGFLAPGRDPEVADTLAGMRRVRATPPRRKTPLLLADLERMVTGIDVKTWPGAPGGLRNRCLLLLGWIGAFRRDELVRLEVRDVTLHADDGLHVAVRQSKTDAEAAGRTYALPYGRQPALCAPCAYLRWRNVVDAWDGTDGGPGGRAAVMRYTRNHHPDRHLCRTGQPAHPTGGHGSTRVFRAVRANGAIGGPMNGEAVNQVVKRAAAAAGFDPERIGGHSLRAGFVTQAFRSGATAHAIMRQTGHRDPKTLEIYARETAPLVGNAVTQLGL
jgi:site-specific recombinase XerD